MKIDDLKDVLEGLIAALDKQIKEYSSNSNHSLSVLNYLKGMRQAYCSLRDTLDPAVLL